MPEQASSLEGGAKARSISRSDILEWVGLAFNSVASRFSDLSHLVEEHKNAVVSIVDRHCPIRASTSEQLVNYQRQLEGYFSLLQGGAHFRNEQELIANEIGMCKTITERIQRIFAEKEKTPIKSTTVEVVEQTSAFPIDKFKSIWKKHLGPLAICIKGLNQQRDALPENVIDVFRAGMKSIEMDLPKRAIDNEVYLEHLREQADELLDEAEEMISSISVSNDKVFHCFDLLAARQRNELEKAVQHLSESEYKLFNQLLEVIGMPPSEVDPAEAVRAVVNGARPLIEEGSLKARALVENLRIAFSDALTEIRQEIEQQQCSLGSRIDITEPMVWRSELITEVDKELKEREEKKHVWFEGRTRRGHGRFLGSKQSKNYKKGEAEYMQEVRGVATDIPPLIRGADFDRIKTRLEAVSGRYDAMLQTHVVPHAGKAVAKVLSKRFDAVCKGIGFKADCMLMTTDVGRIDSGIDLEAIATGSDPLTPDEIEQVLVPVMMRLRRVHTEEYAKLGKRSQSKGNMKTFEMTVRMCLTELPAKIISFEQLFTLMTVPLDVLDNALEMGKRERLHRYGTSECPGQKLDEVTCVVCTREYRNFTHALRRRTWNVRRNLAAQGRVLSQEEEAPTTRMGKFTLITKDRSLELHSEFFRKYQLQNGSSELIGKMDDDLLERVTDARDQAIERIDALFEVLGSQVSQDELVTLRQSIATECNSLRANFHEQEAVEYFDLIEGSYRCVLWHMENEMEMGARMLERDKKSQLLNACQGVAGKKVENEPEEHDFEPIDLSNPGTSSTLRCPTQSGFVEALQRYPIEAALIIREIPRAFRTLQKELPLALGFGHTEEASRLVPLLSQCSDACIASAEEITEGNPIADIETYEQLFGRLAWIFDQVQYRFRGVMCGFLVERFSTVRRRIEKQTLRRVQQEEMRNALADFDDADVSAGNYQGFFTRCVQQLLTQRCRQFLYSCITSSMEAVQIRSIGSAINGAFRSMLDDLTSRVESACRRSGGILTLQEFQVCLSGFVAQVDIGSLGLPRGTEERFKTQVLDSMNIEVVQDKNLGELLQKLPHSGAGDDPSTILEREVTSLLEVQDQQALINLLQTASTHYEHTREHLFALEGVVEIIQAASVHNEGVTQDLEELACAAEALRELYPLTEGALVDANQEQTSSERALQALEHLRRVALQTNVDMYSRERREQQQEIAEGLMHLEQTLQALCHTYFSKDYETKRS